MFWQENELPKKVEPPEGAETISSLGAKYRCSYSTIRRWMLEGYLESEFGWETHSEYCPVRKSRRWWFTKKPNFVPPSEPLVA